MDESPDEGGGDEGDGNEDPAPMERGDQPRGHDKSKVIETENWMGESRQEAFPSIRRNLAPDRVVCACWRREHRTYRKRSHSRAVPVNAVKVAQFPHGSQAFRNSTGLP
jgi:hypothetical protein